MPIQPDKPYLLIDPDTTTQVVTTVEPYQGIATAVLKSTGERVVVACRKGREGKIWRTRETIEYELIDKSWSRVITICMNLALDRYLIPLEDDNLKKESSTDKPVEKPKEEVILV